MKFQTGHLPTPSYGGKVRYCIDHNEWVPGQPYSLTPLGAMIDSPSPPHPVWVHELREIPERAPIVAWIGPRAVAWLSSLPDGTTYAYVPDSPIHAVDGDHPAPDCLVLVVRWPDGRLPQRPTDETDS